MERRRVQNNLPLRCYHVLFRHGRQGATVRAFSMYSTIRPEGGVWLVYRVFLYSVPPLGSLGRCQ